MTIANGPFSLLGRCCVALTILAVTAGCNSGGSATVPPAPSQAVAPPPAPNAAPEQVRVDVTSAGFQPSRVDVGKGRALVFRRTTDKTCATAVVFPALGIEKPLPLNTDVAVDLPPETTGELAFQCGMGMDRGKVVVR
jgi:cupredoxin-like protein